MRRREMANNEYVEELLKLPYTHVLRRDDEGDWIASVEELDGCTTHGDTYQEAFGRLLEMQRAWFEDALESGQPIPKPRQEEEAWSGKWLQRVPPSLHRLIARVAKIEGASLNQWVAVVLAREVGHSLAIQEARTEDHWGRFAEPFFGDVDLRISAPPGFGMDWTPRIVGPRWGVVPDDDENLAGHRKEHDRAHRGARR
jgi:antitoxin HicB